MITPPDNATQPSGTGKATSATRPPEQAALNCPRCDSPNTKFCYYNNYSLSQPRHFCKTCRRYWTKGGSLRNVPIGGGSRKTRKPIKHSSSRFSGTDASSSSGIGGGLKLFYGLPPTTMEFQHFLNGQSYPSPTGFSSSLSLDQSGTSNAFMGLGRSGAVHGLGGTCENVHSNSVASSIESLSSLNQELHWKMQQQRLGMVFGFGDSGSQRERGATSLQPILFENLDVSKQEVLFPPRKGDANEEESLNGWSFRNSGPVPVTQTPTNADSAGNNSGWNGNQAWHDLQQYNNALP